MPGEGGEPFVSRDKIIACVGINEAELAHLRLLLRACERDLAAAWQIGDESSADLLIADVRNFAGEMASTRARGIGLRCAVFTDAPSPDFDLVLKRPLQRSALIELLNRVDTGEPRLSVVEAAGEDFYVRDLGIGMVEKRPTDGHPVAMGLDEALNSRPQELRKEDPPLLRRASDHAPRKYATREAMLEETAQRPMREYLGGDLLRGPVRVRIDAAEPLVFDPKHRTAYIAGGLQKVEPYARGRWRQCDCLPLTNAELARVRAEQVALPYSRLIWLDVLLNSGGHLARHLDPKATFRLTQWVEIDPGYGWVFRIASSMLQPMRLHEIAAASGGKMGDVFDVVNAFDAIGLIEWRTPAPSERERSNKSLFGRFR